MQPLQDKFHSGLVLPSYEVMLTRPDAEFTELTAQAGLDEAYLMQGALREEICEWEWEKADVPGYHTGVLTKDAYFLSGHNSL